MFHSLKIENLIIHDTHLYSTRFKAGLTENDEVDTEKNVDSSWVSAKIT